MTNSSVGQSAVLVDGVEKSYGGRKLWSGLSFSIEPGTLVTLTGPSGSGKTTLLNCMGQLDEFDAGSVSYGDVDVRGAGSRQRRSLFRDTLGFLFQNYGLVESWSVEQNLMVALKFHTLTRSAKRILISEALERVGLDGQQHQRVFALSGGEQQRVALARLIIKRPRIVLADEPTASLDKANADLVYEVLREMTKYPASVLISTHDDGLVSRGDQNIHLCEAAVLAAPAL